jgi:acetoacetate decarboxylase
VQGDSGVPLGGCSYLELQVPVNPVAVKKILPMGMWLTDPPMASLTANRYETFPLGGPFCESALNLHVDSPWGKGLHCVWIVVDDDRSLLNGRDFMAYPKKMADFSFRDTRDHISVSISRHGEPLISMEADILEREEHPAPCYGVKHFNMGGPGQFFFFSPLWAFVGKETIHLSHRVRGTLELTESERDPLANIISGAPVGGRFVKVDGHGVKYFLPLCVTGGPRWFSNSFSLRYR